MKLESKEELDIKSVMRKDFHENLKSIIKIQENILNSSLLTKEKIISANEISVEQIKNFKENSTKYGKFLKNIQTELFLIQDLLKYI
jgi:hypothetical protein